MPNFISDNAIYLGIGAIGLYFIGTAIIKYFSRTERLHKQKNELKPLPRPLEKQNMNLTQLRKYDGKTKPNIVVAVDKKLFEVTKRSDIYGPGGMYSLLAGRDASRALATMQLKEEMLPDLKFDDLSDLNGGQKNSLDEWYISFSQKYGDPLGDLVE